MRLLSVFLASLPCLQLVVAFYPLVLEDDEDFRFIQLMLPINPYTTDVRLTLCRTPEEQERSKLLIADLMTNEVAAARIESFNIEYFCFDRKTDCGCGDLLDSFVELIGRSGDYLKVLGRVRWYSSLGMRPPLLTSLEEQFPSLKLDLEMLWGDPSGLQASPLLHSLHVYFEPSKLDTVKTSPLVTHVQTQIANSPNLVELSMEIGSMGCVIYDVDPKFARLRGRHFPPLEKLILTAFPLSVQNVDYWMENMDWSRMECLDLRDIDEPTYFFNKSVRLAGGLPQLKSLLMELPWFPRTRDHQEFEDTFRRFLDAPRNTGLSEISLEGTYQPYMQTVLDRHGVTLRTLQLHDPERSYEPQREMLSDAELSNLGQRTPNLEDISIDMNCAPDGSFPTGFVETLLSETLFPSLKTIKLFGILGVSNRTLVSHWQYVPTDQRPLLSKLFSRASIDRVQVHVGEDRRVGGGYPADWVLWEQQYWELWVAQRDGFGKMVIETFPRVDRDF